MIKRETIIKIAKEMQQQGLKASLKESIESMRQGSIDFCPIGSCRQCGRLFPRILEDLNEGTCPCEVYSETYLKRCESFALRVLREEKLI